jgi:hypothetical protein
MPTAAPPTGASLPPLTVAPAIEFALVPAQAICDLYDFKTTKDTTIYKVATDLLNAKGNKTAETNIIASATAYIDQQARATQDSYIIFACILASLDSTGAIALRNSEYSYLIDGTACEALLMKVLLLDCEVETASTNFFVCVQLGILERHMVSVGYNNIAFNKRIANLVHKHRQGEDEA